MTTTRPGGQALKPGQRPFSLLEQSLIRKLHGYMDQHQLLAILNERHMADRPDAIPYTIDQLRGAIRAIEAETGQSKLDPDDWAALRKQLAKARREGLLARITDQTVEDFAVVFSLNQRQLMQVKDILSAARED